MSELHKGSTDMPPLTGLENEGFINGRSAGDYIRAKREENEFESLCLTELTDNSVVTPESPREPRGMQLTRKTRVGLLLATLPIVQNVDLAYTGVHFAFAGGEMQPAIAQCGEYQPFDFSNSELEADTITPTTTGNSTSTTTTTTTVPSELDTTKDEDKVADKESSAKNNSLIESVKNLIPALSQYSHILSNYYEGGYESKHSGLDFKFYGTDETSLRDIDYSVFDDLYHMGITTESLHLNPEIRHIDECMRKMILEDKVLDDESVSIIISSQPGECLSDLMIVVASKDTSCNQSAAGLPKIEVEVLMFKPFSERMLMLTTGANPTEEDLRHDLSAMLIHEGGHSLSYFFIEPREDPDEKYVEYLELAAIRSYSADPKQFSAMASIFGLQSRPRTTGPPFLEFEPEVPKEPNIKDLPLAISFDQ